MGHYQGRGSRKRTSRSYDNQSYEQSKLTVVPRTRAERRAINRLVKSLNVKPRSDVLIGPALTAKKIRPLKGLDRELE